MKAYCQNCASHQPSGFRPARDAATGEPYEDLCCDTCHSVVATVQERDAHPQATEPAWRPIESAPTDGTVFLGLHGHKVREAYRVQRNDCEMWCFGGASGDVEIAPWTKPTHWMPLPAAPEAP